MNGGLAQVAVRMVVMMTVVMERLMSVWRDRGRAFWVLAVVMVVLVVWMIMSARVPGQFLGVVWHAPRIWVMMLLTVAVMTVMVMRTPVALKSALLLQLLLDVRGRRVAVSCCSNQGFHCVLWSQA